MLSFESVHFNYIAHQRLIQNVSFTVNAGDMVYLRTPARQGRTTCVRLILGDLKPSQGRIVHHTRRIGVVSPEVLPLFSNLSLLANLTLARNAYPNSLTDDEMEEALHFIGLFTRRHDRPDMLSTSECEALLLLRAVCIRPDLLVVDAVKSDKILEYLLNLAKSVLFV